MRQIINVKELKGKIIADVFELESGWDETIILTFTDETFAVIEGEANDLSSICRIQENKLPHELHEYDDMHNLILKTLGIISEQDYEKWHHNYLEQCRKSLCDYVSDVNKKGE